MHCRPHVTHCESVKGCCRARVNHHDVEVVVDSFLCVSCDRVVVWLLDVALKRDSVSASQRSILSLRYSEVSITEGSDRIVKCKKWKVCQINEFAVTTTF